jgi:uncharacterized pyridoxal phosphate-containing UPF0001 family protein
MSAIRDALREQIPGEPEFEISMPLRNIQDDLETAINTFGVTEIRVGKEVFGQKKVMEKPWERK